jgi:signal transduction histidine kinase
LPSRFPSLAGLGYAAYTSRHGLERLQVETRAAGRGLLTVFPRGVREFYGPILYIEPKTAENLSVIGYDMYSEPVRHAAMEAAWRAAAPRMTGRVRLLQDLDPTSAGLLIYVPVFRGGTAPQTAPQRQGALTGWVYAPVRVARFVQQALKPIKREVTFRMFDATDGQSVLLYEDPQHAAVQEPAFVESRDVLVYGRTWHFEFASPPIEEAVPALGPLRTALVVGLLASLLLFGIAWSLAYTEMRAQRLAAQMTEAVRRSEARVRGLNRSLEVRVETRTRELSEANRELESFAYSVSHDLRAPLRAIEGFGRVLEDRYQSALDDTGRDYLRRVRGAAARMGELIESLLKVSRVTRGALQVEGLDLTRMAEEIVGELRAADPNRVVDVVIQPALQARGDRALVHSLLQNLLGNAWKFTRDREDARIVFGREEGGDVDRPHAFFVHDNGVGFEQTYVDKLFRPFQRLHDEERFAGEGIGLATVKRIVERHGGSILASGRPGHGAVFTFTLG